jgi:hypothetical protein
MLPTKTAAAISALVLHVLWPSAVTGQTTGLVLKSQPGDYIGSGVDREFSPENGIFTASRTFDNGVHVFFNGGEHWWDLSFAAPYDGVLVPGVYQNAIRWPLQSRTGAGLSIWGEGRGCNTLFGRFEVLEASYSTTGEVERFAATFEQHCDGTPPMLLGSIMVNSTLPPFAPPPSRCVSTVATIADLDTEVNGLVTDVVLVNDLDGLLVSAQWNVGHQQPRIARSVIEQFMARLVQASNRAPANPHAIAVATANTLTCGAANVLTNIAIP